MRKPETKPAPIRDHRPWPTTNWSGPMPARMYEVILPKKLGYFGKVQEVLEDLFDEQAIRTVPFIQQAIERRRRQDRRVRRGSLDQDALPGVGRLLDLRDGRALSFAARAGRRAGAGDPVHLSQPRATRPTPAPISWPRRSKWSTTWWPTGSPTSWGSRRRSGSWNITSPSWRSGGREPIEPPADARRTRAGEDSTDLALKSSIDHGARWTAADRTMTMHAMPVMLGVLAILAVAYRYYSAFLAARVAALDDARVTPAHRFNDGQNFDPTNRWVLFGHHFAAISGAGPLIGPVLAIQFGYMPGLVWLVVGVCLAGAVQDMMVLAASTRRGGLSLAGLARAEIGRPAGLAAAIAILYIVIIALAAWGSWSSRPWAARRSA